MNALSTSSSGTRLKRAIKSAVSFAALTLTAPLAFPGRRLRRCCGRDVLFEGQSQLMALLPGKTGVFFCAACDHWTLRACPLDVAIPFGAVFAHSDVRLEHRVYVGVRCSLGRVEIRDDCMLADHVQALSGRHQHGISGDAVSFQAQEKRFETVAVGANCWLGVVDAWARVIRPIRSDGSAHPTRNLSLSGGLVCSRKLPEAALACSDIPPTRQS